MKKTLITLLALGGLAMGETVTVNPLKIDAEWTHSLFNDTKSATWVLDDENGILKLDNSNWSRSYSNFTFEEALSATETQPLTFSFDVTRGTGSAAFSIALQGNTKAVVIGTKDYTNGSAYYGTSTNTTAGAYYFNDQTGPVTVTGEVLRGDCFNYSATATFSGSAVLDGDGNTILTITANSSSGDQGAVSKSINLGQNFQLVGLSVYGDGNNAVGNWSVSNMTFTGDNVPEPTTATLSLLALAGLAARRRRK